MKLGDRLGASNGHVLSLILDLRGGFIVLSKGVFAKAIGDTRFTHLFVSNKDYFPGVVGLIFQVRFSLDHMAYSP